ncbi:hypothetical protein CVT25_007482 [Psilocybe cyanescens]|uniref:Uncharacterized protein n=1 Tax=Psilocybe cyanescens TaxID=93625 RepID=A0A409XVR7_PSICY|nr:hypothetical protein CVT25_007482 [Psilocybe cyanescens]
MAIRVHPSIVPKQSAGTPKQAMGVYKVIGERIYSLFNPRSMCEYWDTDGTFHQRSRVGFLPIIWIHGQVRPTVLTWDNLLGIELSAAASHAPKRFALTPSGVIVSMIDATTIRHVLSEEKQRLGPVSQIKFRAIAFPEQTTWPLLWTRGVWSQDRNDLQVDRLTSNDTDNLFRSLLSTHDAPTREWFLEEQEEESKDRAGKRKRAVLDGVEETATGVPMACERAHKRQRRSEGCLEGIFDFVPTTP